MALDYRNKKKVLFIGSNNQLLNLLTTSIEQSSSFYEATSFDLNTTDLKSLTQLPYDVIVYDFDNITHQLEIDLLYLKQLNSSIPIIVLTNIDDPNHALKLLSLGASDFVTKHSTFHRYLPRIITTNIQRSLLIDSLHESLSKIERNSRDEALMNKFMITIHNNLHQDDIVKNLCRQLSDVFDASRAIISLAMPPKNKISIAYQYLKNKNKYKNIREDSVIFSSYVELATRNEILETVVVIKDDTFRYAQNIKYEMQYYDIKSLVLSPFSYRGQYNGYIYLDHCEDIKFWNNSDLQLLNRISNQLAIALSHSKLYQIIEDHSISVDKLSDLCNELTRLVSSSKLINQLPDNTSKNQNNLTNSEILILKLLAQGLSNKEITQQMNTKLATTDVRISKLKKKLNIDSRASLIKYAISQNLI